MTRKKSEDAVSPVIGVMLMLVVTVVIAAVVAVFATGMVEDTEPAPVAKLDVNIYSAYEQEGFGYTVPTMHITHVSGDPLDTADLKLSFSWECDEHGQHTSTYQYTGEERWGTYSSSAGSTTPFDTEGVSAPALYTGETIEPLYINYGNIGGAFFGTHILKRGEILIAYDLHLPRNTEHKGNPAMDALFNDGDVITERAKTVEKSPVYCMKCTVLTMKTDEATVDPDTKKCSLCNTVGMINPKCPQCNIQGYFNNQDLKCMKCGFSAISTKISGFTEGIMECLPEGTSVDVMITHIPSNKLIYSSKVFVE